MSTTELIDRAQLAKRIYQSAKLQGRFTLRSGEISDTYFDKYRFEADPKLLQQITLAMQSLLDPQTQVLAGMELGGIPLATLLSQHSQLPCAFVRKQAKTYGTCLMTEGAAVAGRRVCLVEDVVSTGGALIEKIAELRANEGNPDAAPQIIQALCVIDRSQRDVTNRSPSPGQQALAKLGVPLRALFSMAELERTAI